jgi:protein-tyrosine phosphatase
MAFWRKRGKATVQYRVLMVCMGNICRSPTAEAVLRRKLEVAGLGDVVEVDSAGTTDYHTGERPDGRATKQASLRGYDLSKLRARQATADDFERFDLILAMDNDNLDGLQKIAPEGGTATVQLLLDHATDPARPRGDGSVPDPYYGGAAGFEHVLDLVEHACDGLVSHIRERLANLQGTPAANADQKSQL